MKKYLLLFLILSFTAKSQDISIVKGDLNGLKNISSYDIQFNYDSITIGKGISEEVYIKTLAARWEDREKGKGEIFVQKWQGDRVTLFEPAFKKSFEKQSGISLENKDAQYTMIMKTRHLEGGVDIVIYPVPALVGGDLWIVETANPGNVKAVIRFREIPGTYDWPGDFEMTKRIKSAYDRAGMWLSIFLLKHRKK